MVKLSKMVFLQIYDYVVNDSLIIHEILYFNDNSICINRPISFGDPSFKTSVDFLNHFKIPFKDIV